MEHKVRPDSEMLWFHIEPIGAWVICQGRRGCQTTGRCLCRLLDHNSEL
jgi:hypothetical protein